MAGCTLASQPCRIALRAVASLAAPLMSLGHCSCSLHAAAQGSSYRLYAAPAPLMIHDVSLTSSLPAVLPNFSSLDYRIREHTLAGSLLLLDVILGAGT